MRLEELQDEEDQWIEESKRLALESPGEVTLEEWTKSLPIEEGVLTPEEFEDMNRNVEEFYKNLK